MDAPCTADRKEPYHRHSTSRSQSVPSSTWKRWLRRPSSDQALRARGRRFPYVCPEPVLANGDDRLCRLIDEKLALQNEAFSCAHLWEGADPNALCSTVRFSHHDRPASAFAPLLGPPSSERAPFLFFINRASLCLSRACLGKTSSFFNRKLEG